MARIAGVTIDELGRTLFSNTFGTHSDLDQLVKSDFKEFHIAEHQFGVGQITSYDSVPLMQRKNEMLEILREINEERKYSFTMLMITDVLLSGTWLLYVGSDDIIRHAFNLEPKDHMVFLPHVMSRKKQVIPALSDLWG